MKGERMVLVVLIGIVSAAAVAEVKPLAEPWLKAGETLVCYGDSITAGAYYVPHLKTALEAKGITVINAGLGGDKTPMALTRITEVAAHKPDAVMFFFGANDSLIGRGRWRDEPVVEPTTFRDNLLWMIHYFRLHTTCRKFSIVAPPGCFEGESCGAFGNIGEPYRLAAREAADRANAVLIPLDAEFGWIKDAAQKGQKDLLLTRDGIHFSPFGSQRAAEIMLRHWRMADK